MIDPEQLKAAIEAIKAADGDAALAILEGMLVGEAGGEVAPDAAAALAEVPAEPPVEDPLAAQLAAQSRELTALRAAVGAITAERVSADNVTRRGLVAQLVELGIETPATAWQGDASERKPCARLGAESVVDMTSRIATLRQALGAVRLNARPAAPTAGSLSAHEQAAANKIKDPEARERFLARRIARLASV